MFAEKAGRKASAISLLSLLPSPAALSIEVGSFPLLSHSLTHSSLSLCSPQHHNDTKEATTMTKATEGKPAGVSLPGGECFFFFREHRRGRPVMPLFAPLSVFFGRRHSKEMHLRSRTRSGTCSLSDGSEDELEVWRVRLAVGNDEESEAGSVSARRRIERERASSIEREASKASKRTPPRPPPPLSTLSFFFVPPLLLLSLLLTRSLDPLSPL